MFQGTTQINLDAKGRLAVPTKLREGLARPGDGKVVVTAHPHGCLLLYPAPAWEPIRAKVMSYSSLETQASLLQTLLVGFANETEMDSAGRLLLTTELRGFAGLEKEVMLVGQGTHYKIWNKAGWDRQIEQIRSQGPKLLPPGMENLSL